MASSMTASRRAACRIPVKARSRRTASSGAGLSELHGGEDCLLRAGISKGLTRELFFLPLLRGYLTGQTDGSTDCATLRRRERTRALGFAPLENEMWSQRRRSCRRSGEVWSHGPAAAAADGKMWSHFVFLVYGRIPAPRPLLSGGYPRGGVRSWVQNGCFLAPQGRNLMITVPCHNQTCFGRQSTHQGRIRT